MGGKNKDWGFEFGAHPARDSAMSTTWHRIFGVIRPGARWQAAIAAAVATAVLASCGTGKTTEDKQRAGKQSLARVEACLSKHGVYGLFKHKLRVAPKARGINFRKALAACGVTESGGESRAGEERIEH